ncbi:efflux RND transporter periplasmic adaptor subunit [Corallococcus sp. RDP092CA]|uniref:efflux RND transporter periplasmic adaptor subunit n=1 Tax=Corallococcus sp. RDP092CA TaxID=3109369 RepID=UPI0035AEF139
MKSSARTRILGGLALASVLAVAVWAGSRASRPAPLPRERQAPEAVTAPLPSGRLGFVGVVISESADVSAPFDGVLERLTVRLDDAVEAGTELGRLDPTPLQQEVAMAEARLAAAQAEADRAALEARAASELLERYLRSPTETFSETELSQTRYQVKAAQVRHAAALAGVRERQAALAQARKRLADTTLRAPFAGRVVERWVDAGGRVAGGAPLVRLLRTGPVQVRFAIPEEQLGEVRAGAPVGLELSSSGRTLPGHVERIAPEVDAASRMVFALATFDAPGDTASVVVGTAARVVPRPVQAR